MTAPCVVVADSDANLCKVLVARVQRMGIQCLVAHDAESLMQVVRSTAVSLAIIDWRLPPRGGLSAVEAVQHQQPEVRFVLTTTEEVGSLPHETTGVKAVLQKPFDLEAFADLVWREIYCKSLSGDQPFLQNGERLVIELKTHGYTFSVDTRIVSQNDHFLQLEILSYPVDWKNFTHSTVIARFAREDGIYQFRTRLEWRQAPSPSLWARKPTSIHRLQRRRYTRIKQIGQVALARRSEHDSAPITIVGELHDLSLGGFSALLLQPPVTGEEVSFQITLSNANLSLVGKAKAVRTGEMLTERIPAPYRVGFRFTRISAATRQQLRQLLEQTPQTSSPEKREV